MIEEFAAAAGARAGDREQGQYAGAGPTTMAKRPLPPHGATSGRDTVTTAAAAQAAAA
jgi:hypothetical protein